MADSSDDQLREQWRRWCEQVAAASGKTYEEVVADLEAGNASLQITLEIPPPKHRQH